MKITTVLWVVSMVLWSMYGFYRRTQGDYGEVAIALRLLPYDIAGSFCLITPVFAVVATVLFVFRKKPNPPILP